MYFYFRKLGLDLVPRQGAQMVDPETMSLVELYHVHVASAENSQQGVSVRLLKIGMQLRSFRTTRFFFIGERDNQKTGKQKNLDAPHVLLYEGLRPSCR